MPRSFMIKKANKRYCRPWETDNDDVISVTENGEKDSPSSTHFDDVKSELFHHNDEQEMREMNSMGRTEEVKPLVIAMF
ncbi:hypothetical protein Btru_010931 [Bulinus truncatus]|nr:hypothetical protein Btru_010931 [Bulinus truncatus]